MGNELARPSVCWCRFYPTSASICRLLYLLILLFTYTHAQQTLTATIESSNFNSKEESQTTSIIHKDGGYFWAQTRNHEINLEQIYDETTDPIHEGMRNERRSRTQEDWPEYEPEAEYDPRRSYKNKFAARYENVVDREMPDMGAGQGQPCSRGKVCSQREESRAFMIAKLKQNILMQLKMTEPPNITVPKISFDSPPLRRIFKKYGIKPESHQAMPDLDEDPDWVDDETTKEKVISYARIPPFTDQPGSYFKFNEEDMIHTVTSAVLWFYKSPTPPGMTSLALEFYRYQVNTTHPDAPFVAVKFNRKVLNNIGHKGHWLNVAITAEVSRWFINPNSNLGFDVRSPEAPGAIISRPTPGHEDKKPMLEVDLRKNEHSRRRKRDIGSLTCTEHSAEPRCCRYDFQINFQDMGWDWIINPTVYKSFYCSGDCPLLFLQGNQNKILAMQNGRPKAAAPCCTPTRMLPMSMLYFDNEENIIYSEVPDMVVSKCGCK